jgi:hypothetical protein
MEEKNQKLQESNLSQRINDFFSSDKNQIGSKERLLNLVDTFQNKNNPLFLIAGSWGIEIISGVGLKHDDIDLIVLQNPPYYVDDATEIEESCFDVIPLDINYFEENIIRKNIFGRDFYLPSFNLQVCLKLIGQLQEELPERAINQLKILLDSYEKFSEEKSEKEIEYILRKLIPNELNSSRMSKNIILALKQYFQGKNENAIEELVRLHSLINKSLRYQFEKRGLTKKIKISDK